MTTTVTLTVGSTGRQYTTLQAAIDSITNKSLVASDTAYIFEMYPDSEFTGVIAKIMGFTCDATRNFTIKCAVGKSFRNNANVLTNALTYNSANGVAMTHSSNYEYAIEADAGAVYTVIDGLQIKGSAYTSTGIKLDGDNCIVSNCLVDGRPQINNFVALVRLGGDNSKILNCVGFNQQPSAHGFVVGPNGLIDECTIVTGSERTSGGTGASVAGSGSGIPPGTIRNTAIFGFGTPIDGAAGMINADGHNATDAATLAFAATGSKTGLVTANQFNSTSITGTDLRLKAGSALIDAGSSSGTATSINGVARPSGAGFDIGAWETPSAASSYNVSSDGAGVVGTPDVITVTVNGTLASSVTFTPSDNGGGGSFSPNPLIIASGSSTGTVNYTPGSTGTKSISFTNNGTLSNPAAISFTVAARPPSGAVTSQPAPDGQNLTITFSTTDNPTSGLATLSPDPTTPNGAVTTSGTVTLGTNTGTATFTAIPPGNYSAPTITLNNTSGTPGNVTGTQPVSIVSISGSPQAPDPTPVTDTAPPTFPSGAVITTSNVTATSFTASWPNATDDTGVVGYEYSLNGGANFTQIGLVTSYTPQQLSPSTTIQFQVRAYDAANNKSIALAKAVTTNSLPDTQAPQFPVNAQIYVTSITSSGFNLAWDAATDNVAVTSYEYTLDNGVTWLPNGTATNVVVSGQASNTLFNIRVRASDAVNNKSASLTATATTLRVVTVPGAPTNVVAVAGNGAATVTFIPPVNDGGSPITGYEVTGSGGQVRLENNLTITLAVPNDVPVTFTVKAINAQGKSVASAPSNTVTPVLSVNVVSVSISPQILSVNGSDVIQFVASVLGTGPITQAVNWSVTKGTITQDGVFSAPPAEDNAQPIVISAQSQSDLNVIGTMTIMVSALVQVRMRNYSGNIRTKYGTAVEGAQVQVFDQATREKVMLWKDELKTQPIFNPLITDSEGYFEFFVESSQCGYDVSGFSIQPYTRNNIFDVATAVDLNPLQNQLNQLATTKASVDDLNQLAASKASVTDLNQLSLTLQAQLQEATSQITVNHFVTGGEGTEQQPWTGWDTAITWSPYTQYDFEDGYYAYEESPNFALNFLKLNGKQGTFLVHTGVGYAMMADGGATTGYAMGVDINVRLVGNANSQGGVFMRACTYSKFALTFYNVPGVCFTEWSGVLNKYDLKSTDLLGNQIIHPVSLLESNRRVGSLQSSSNEYMLVGERMTGFVAVLNDCSNSRFISGTAALSAGGLNVSVTSDGNTFNNIDFNSNTGEDITCYGDFNTFNGVRSGNSATFVGTNNVVQGGVYDRVNNSGSYNNFSQIAYGINKGSFNDSGKATVKRSVVNMDTGVQDAEQTPAVSELAVLGKTSLSADTLNIGNGQLYKNPDGKFNIGTNVFINDCQLQVVNPSSTATSEGFRVTLANDASFTTTAKALIARTGGSDVWQVLGNGNVQNVNNSYGAISDIRYKQNVVPATPKLDKLLQVNVVNYNLIGRNEQLLGVISQELEQIFPSMIETVPVLDDYGNKIDEYKAVKYSVFVPMLIKALQELTQRVAALEQK